MEIGLAVAGATLLCGLLAWRTRWGWVLVWVALAMLAILIVVYGNFLGDLR